MNDMKSYFSRDTMEVKTKDLFLSVLLRWKKVLLIALIFALLLSGYVVLNGVKKLGDNASILETQAEYQRLLDDYERNRAQAEKKIEDIETELDRQGKYRDTSVMLLVNPYAVHVERISYFVDTDYEIVPSQYYQNPDYTNTLTNAYTQEIDGMDFDEVVIKASGDSSLNTHNPVNGNNLRLVTTMVKDESGIFTVTIYGDSSERVDVIKEAITEQIESRKADFDKMIGTHNLEVVSETSTVSVVKDFVMLRDAFNSNYDKASADLEVAKTNLDNLEEPKDSTISMRNIIERAVKYFILGFIVGLAIAVLLVAGYLVQGEKLLNPIAFARELSIPSMGVISEKNRRGLTGKLEKLVGMRGMRNTYHQA